MICTLGERANLLAWLLIVGMGVVPEDICVCFQVVGIRAGVGGLWSGVAVRVGFQFDAHSALAVVVVSCSLSGGGADGANCFTRRLGL